jgi:hypothetical protein
MHIDLTSEQRHLLLQLVDSAIRDMGPEIRHTTTRTYKEDLKQQRRDLRQLRNVLLARGPSDVEAPPDLVGTP